MERLKPQRPDFIVILGDLTWGGEPEIDKPRSFATLLDAIQRAGRPGHLVMGNTDVSSGDDPARIFETATKIRPFYSFDSGGVHLIVLFTEKSKPERLGTVNEEQLAWLKADLSKLKIGTPVVLFSHHALHNDAKWVRIIGESTMPHSSRRS
jgi:3',5'-cyclic AMP phosphodiesterase CpdA